VNAEMRQPGQDRVRAQADAPPDIAPIVPRPFPERVRPPTRPAKSVRATTDIRYRGDDLEA
jgi:hypothetical protein